MPAPTRRAEAPPSYVPTVIDWICVTPLLLLAAGIAVVFIVATLMIGPAHGR